MTTTKLLSEFDRVNEFRGYAVRVFLSAFWLSIGLFGVINSFQHHSLFLFTCAIICATAALRFSKKSISQLLNAVELAGFEQQTQWELFIKEEWSHLTTHRSLRDCERKLERLQRDD